MLYGELKSAGVEEGVSVEQDGVLALGFVEGEIVGCTEAEVHVAADEANGDAGGGELAGDHLGGAVGGGVIDYEDFGGLVVGETGALGQEGFEAVAQQVASIVGDDDDRNRVGVGGAEVHRSASSIERDGVGWGVLARLLCFTPKEVRVEVSHPSRKNPPRRTARVGHPIYW